MIELEFTLLSIRNFQSYGNNTTVFDLRRPGTTKVRPYTVRRISKNLHTTKKSDLITGQHHQNELQDNRDFEFPKGIITDCDNGDTIYTEEGQNAFNEFYDKFLTMIEGCKVF